MPFERAGQLARFTPSARPDDSLALVAENLRSTPYGAIPVLDRLAVEAKTGTGAAPGAHVIGIIDERDLTGLAAAPRLRAALEAVPVGASEGLGFFANGGAPAAVADLPRNGHSDWSPPVETDVPATAASLMRLDSGFVPSVFSLENTMMALQRYDALALPVVDADGSYLGMVSRADVVAAMGAQVRPPLAGGMATPLGVWLTTGKVTGGAPPLGLFLSGATLGVCLLMSRLLLLLGVVLASGNNPQLAAAAVSGRAGEALTGNPGLDLLLGVLQTLLFCLMLRVLPLSGIHAAEHQTVWAMEKGLPLTPEYVARMPRAHPRCGTNLMTLAGLIVIIFGHLPSFDPQIILLALFFVYLTWRTFGTWMQQWLTTRPASPAQLESGIKAGRELLANYQTDATPEKAAAATSIYAAMALSALGASSVLAIGNSLFPGLSF